MHSVLESSLRRTPAKSAALTKHELEAPTLLSTLPLPTCQHIPKAMAHLVFIGSGYYTKKGPSSRRCGDATTHDPKALTPDAVSAIPPPHSTRSIRLTAFQERLQLVRAAWMTQLAQCLSLDLANPLTRHVKLLAHLFQRVIRTHLDTKAHAQHLGLTRCQ